MSTLPPNPGRPGAGADRAPGATRLEIAAAAVIRHGAQGPEVLIGHRPAGAVRGGVWELPGGKCDPGEDAPRAASRELNEETGLVLDPQRGVLLGRVEQDDPHLAKEHSIAITVVAFALPDGAPEPRALACDELRWERLDRLDGYRWPAANARLNLILQDAALTDRLPRHG